MPTRFTYLIVDVCCILVPLLASFHSRIRFYRQWRYFLLPCLLTAIFFVLWDAIFTSLGVWRFNPLYLTGYHVGNLPLEELAFFICIPYACVFTYYCCTLFITKPLSAGPVRVLTVLLINMLLITAGTHLSHLYTSVTFILLSLLLAGLSIRRVHYLPMFYFSFLLILIPFFISNGILTGSFTDQPVVIYNNRFNLGIRMGTIPVEDTFYGMLLLLMNVAGYQYLLARAAGRVGIRPS